MPIDYDNFSGKQMVRGFLALIVLIGCSLGFSFDAKAQLALDKIVIDFIPGSSNRQDVVVRNTWDETVYVDVEPAEILNPGEKTESRAPIRDPREAGLLISPVRLAINPGGSRRIRVVNIRDNFDSERIFRVRVRPVIGDVEAEVTGIKVLVGYDMLVMVRPNPMAPKLEHEIAGNTLTLRNTGNTNIMVGIANQCRAPDDCEEIAIGRLYAGNKIVAKLPLANTPVEFTARIGDEFRSYRLE
ncbi:MAG TPA: hypothetical protein DCZ06_10830 [Alphaproteobacteria bacterium]|nr:hypothetical protein [Alphaproteobacteria bacterium]